MSDGMGKVWLVGAGPSDPGLFTLKGKQVLESADVVVYDRLVGDGVLSMMPASAELIDVGKQSGSHPVPQEEIDRILLDKALEGKRVVRLKGGDPFVFGRGGEELELLVQHNVPFEIVPGITAAVAVPAYAGIPVTHREYSSSLHLITAHGKRGSGRKPDYAALARLEGTLVFFMGVAALEEICRELMANGMAADTPAAILERGTTSRQRRVVSTLANLKQDADAAEIGTPALIVVGKVCALADRFHWAEDRPLGGQRVIVTRPRKRSSALAEALRERGAEVVLLPSIETQPLQNAAITETLHQLNRYSWIAFTSAEGVECFFTHLRELRIDVRSLGHLRFAAIGAATAKAIEERGVLVELVPEVYTGAALGVALAQRLTAEDRVLFPRSRIGTEDVLLPLQAVGIPYTDLPVYDTVYAPQEQLELREDDIVTFTSASTVRGFVQMLPQADFTRVRALCIGEMTAREAERHGMQITVSRRAAVESMVERLEELCADHRN